jgi:hypothetical protein
MVRGPTLSLQKAQRQGWGTPGFTSLT